MRSRLALFGAFTLLLQAASSYREALPGYVYSFPKDHFNHPEFQTEWWYYTGNLHDAAGRRFGFELTFFRHAVTPTSNSTSVWDVRDVWLAHFAVSDLDGNRFFHTERLNRSGAALAGASEEKGRVWNGNWSSTPTALQASAEHFGVNLRLVPEKRPVIHGSNGVSQKAEGKGRASHYISLTRINTQGTLQLDGKVFEVTGLSWMDHEFFTHQLSSEQVGWDWFSLQFDDSSELMLFRLRHKDGSADPYSAGTYVDPQGRARQLSLQDFTLSPGKTWESKATGGKYPVAWRVQVPSAGVDVQLTTKLPKQELTSKAGAVSAYWEGAVDVAGTKRGSGYLEMTGYTGAVRMGN